MRILSWNINGIRTLPQYHPWNTFKDCSGILDELRADIVCFQEMKSSRAILPRDVATPSGYTSFFSFPITKGGYSGVAVYTKSASVVPIKAEEGLSGKLQPKPPLTDEERIARRYPSIDDVELFPDEEGNVPATFDALDAEGRGLVLDFGLFVLINVYCPNETSDARTSFKMNYHLLLEARVRQLIEEGREVIVLGDMNICATPLDHCDGHLPSNATTFWDHPARAWFRQWLNPNGPMTDVVRTYWPERKGLYTCWNTRISARETNYGTRVDYILVTRGLLKWIKHGDIQPSLKGSDHCPIYIDLHDEITLASGEVVKLRDVMRQTDPPPGAPRIAAKHWDEFSGKQKLLSSFFGKKGEILQAPEPSAGFVGDLDDTPSSSQASDISSMSFPRTTEAGPSTATRKQSTASNISKKRPLAPSSSQTTSKKTKKDPSQSTLGSFFNKPKVDGSGTPSKRGAGKSKPVEVITVDEDVELSTSTRAPTAEEEAQLEADYRLACELASSQDIAGPSSSPSSSQSKAAWSSLFTPVQPPKCTIHGEPTKRYTVNKPGPNKGRAFYLCSRPVGPGYDKGKGERLRHEVDHQYRCNYFKWASDLKRDTPSS